MLIVCVQGMDRFPTTTSGSLRGSQVYTSWGEAFVYRGVRYAPRPERFGLPQPYRVQDPALMVDAINFAPSCPQPVHITELGYSALTKNSVGREISEDCLFLNVYVPATTTPKPRAVMVWIPGEGFSFADAAQFDGTYLAVRGNVIVITVQYRVGSFGFLSTGNKTIPGNQGIWDIIEALRWIHQNIQQFDGDVSRITLFGRFTGGKILSILLASPELVQRSELGYPETLVNRMILQSGIATGPYSFDLNPANTTATFAEATGCRGTMKQMISCLKALPVDYILKSMPVIGKPVIDGKLIPMDPMKAVKKTVYNRNIDVMIGETSGEGSICLLSHFYLETIYATQIMSNNITKKDFADLVREHTLDYFKVADPSVIDATVHEYRLWTQDGNSSFRDQFLNYCGMLYTRAKNEQFARFLTRSGTGTWRYEFNHRPSISHHPDFMGPAHGDEVIFVFGLIESDSHNPISKEEILLEEEVIQAWSNFAKTGNPNFNDDELSNNSQTWPQFLDNSRQQRIFTTENVKKGNTNFLSRDVDFWSSLVPSLLRNNQKGIMQGRSAACNKPKQASLNQVTCPAVTSLIVLCIIMASALLLIGLYLFYIIKKNGKSLLDQEHTPQ